MTFLELCQRLRKEVGAAGNGPASVSSQAGEYARLVSWIETAWHELQNSRNWAFDWAKGAVELNAMDTVYPLPADFDLWRAETLRFKGFAVEVLPWSQMSQVGNDTFACVAQSPDGLLHTNATPEVGGDLTFEYFRTPQRLINNTDTPRMPERFHMAIVYRAMIQYGLYENAPEVVQQARINDATAMFNLVHSQLPRIGAPEPLA